MNQDTAQRSGPGPGNEAGDPPRTTVRSFVAVPLPAASRAAILAALYQAGPDGGPGLAARLPDIRWSRRPENLHVTLKFLGQVDAAVLARLVAALAQGLAPLAGFEVGLRGVGAFPSSRDAQVIWVGVDDPQHRLAAVAAIIEQVADSLAAGDPKARAQSQRPFVAHITVGRTPRRARHHVDATAALVPWTERDFGRVPVDEVHLYESITGGDASTYVLRGTATLQKVQTVTGIEKGALHGDGQDREQGRN